MACSSSERTFSEHLSVKLLNSHSNAPVGSGVMQLSTGADRAAAGQLVAVGVPQLDRDTAEKRAAPTAGGSTSAHGMQAAFGRLALASLKLGC